MISASRTILLSVWLAIASTGAGASEFADMVRNLNGLQSDLAHGGAAAKAAIAKQIEQLEKAIPAMDAESWADQKNARAAAIFLLSGGSPRAIRKVADGRVFSERDLPLISGSLAYAEGRSQDAAKLLSGIDPRAQPVTLGGHLALIKGGLLMGSDNARAQELFDLARLLMPSSLVEEAALRREISIMNPARSPEKFVLLGRRYVAQYSKSPFSRNFWDEIGASTVRVALDMEEARLAEIQALFHGLAASTKFELYMAVARMAILHARIALASEQTKRAEPFAETHAARNRLKLYLAAVDALSGNFEDAANELQQVELNSISRADLEMREIVTATIRRLQFVPETDASDLAAAKKEPQSEAQPASTIERSARQALADADALLQKASKK